MQPRLPTEQRNYVLACIIQALVGALTPNFRRVSFTLQGTLLSMRFSLKESDEHDMEEISDILFELEALLVGEYEVRSQVEIRELSDLEEQSQIVFRMKD